MSGEDDQFWFTYPGLACRSSATDTLAALAVTHRLSASALASSPPNRKAGHLKASRRAGVAYWMADRYTASQRRHLGGTEPADALLYIHRKLRICVAESQYDGVGPNRDGHHAVNVHPWFEHEAVVREHRGLHVLKGR
jgi:hypothetical protein